MKALVTGCAGFIGSHLCERLIGLGADVVGIDNFTPFYPRADKQRNLEALSGMDFIEGDLATMDLSGVLKDVNTVYHLAAEAGVRSSWGPGFEAYVHNNVRATQNLLEFCAGRQTPLPRLVFASSASVYGDCDSAPVTVNSPLNPASPYGVSKLAAERLCLSYGAQFHFPVTAVRYFSVYGPRQRPDMGLRKFIEAAFDERPITIFGDWTQTREFTYVEDVVNATVTAATLPSQIFNVSGGARTSLPQAIRLISEAVGKPVLLQPGGFQAGDVGHIHAADGSELSRPTVTLEEGIAREVAWCRARREALTTVEV